MKKTKIIFNFNLAKKILLAFLVLSLSQANIACCTTFFVSNANDSGPGSLRDNLASSINGDTILFSTQTYGIPIVLLSQLEITTDVVIIGNGPSVTILDGNGTNRIFHLSAPSTLNIYLLTMTHGYSISGNGGAFFNEGVVYMEICNFLENKSDLFGGAIYNTGTFALNCCNIGLNNAIGNSGGGIYSSGNIGIGCSSIYNNSANGFGGGIYCSGITYMGLCTISSNFTNNFDGGGIANIGKVQILNSTITKNVAGRSGGGVSSDIDSLLLFNSIIAGNNSNGAPDVINNSPLDPLCYNNLIGDNTGLNLPAANGNILDVDAQLGPLGDNSGFTLTHALHCNSPAINNAYGPASTPNDQRGINRIVPDIGSYEFEPSVNPVVSTIGDNGFGTLREAIESSCPNQTILFSSMIDGDTIFLNNEISIGKPIALLGNGQLKTIISGSSTNRIFNIPNSDSVYVRMLSLIDGYSIFDNGGAIYNFGNLSINNVQILNNRSDAFGGAVFNNGNMSCIYSTFRSNHALGNSGGAIYNNGGLVHIEKSTFNSNDANGFGGAISGSQCFLLNSTISGNSSRTGGGGINCNSNIIAIGSTITLNSSNGDGGGVLNDGGQIEISNSIISGNTSTGNGQDVYNAGTISMSSSNNLIGDNTGFGIPSSGNNILNVDPMLASLGNNGGRTQTHALTCGSLAIDAGDLATSTVGDQRDSSRNGKPDIGAYEFRTLNLEVGSLGSDLFAHQVGGSYQWFNCNSNSIIVGEIGQNFSPATNGNYAVIVSNSGCTDTSACVAVTTLGINLANLIGEISIYPDPVRNYLMINHKFLSKYKSVKILSLTGNVIRSFEINSISEIQLDVSFLVPSLYFIELIGANNICRSKFVKE